MAKHIVVNLFFKASTNLTVSQVQSTFTSLFPPAAKTAQFRVYDQGTHPEYYNQYPGAVSGDTIYEILVDVYPSASSALTATVLKTTLTSALPSGVFVATSQL